jgi:branched-subunit amino acid ABC-type transport system permease component
MLDFALQLFVNGIIAGMLIAVPAIGFTMIFAVLRFPNFAIAGHATIGAFAGYSANVFLGLHPGIAIIAAFLIAGAFGAITDDLALKSLRKHGALTAAIGSIALTVVLENVVRFGYGNDFRSYDLPIYRDWHFAGLNFGRQQLENAGWALAIMTLMYFLLSYTKLGKAMRAVADNPTLAAIKGIDPIIVGRTVSFVGMGLAGVGGMLLGLDTAIDPLTGFRIVITVFAAAVIGGLGNIPGAVLGALVIGVGEQLSLLVIEPTYRSAVGFLAILLVLTLRPRGLLGERVY